ncbi:MAG: cell division protein SepF [Candidatus Bathyarchaeia archaeon]
MFKVPSIETTQPTSSCPQLIGSDDERDERFPLVNPSIQHPIYVKAYPLRDPMDVPRIKAEIIEGNILIVKITPIAKRSVEETKSAIGELVEFVKSIQGDIARLGEERIVMTPPTVKVWRGRENSRLEVATAGATANNET